MVILAQALLLPLMAWTGTPTIYQGAFWLREFLGTMQMTVWGAYAMVGRSLGAALAAHSFGAALSAGAYPLAFVSAGGLALLAALAVSVFFRPVHAVRPGHDL